MVIYADVIFFVNFISTLVLILAYAIMFSCKRHIFRAVAASAVSGLYAIAESLFGVPYILRLAVLFLIIYIVFGKYAVLYNTLRFVFVSICIQIVFIILMSVMGSNTFIANGSITVFSGNILGFILYIMSFPLLLLIRRLVKLRLRFRDCRFTIMGQSIKITLLYDSGNLMIHNGIPVAVVAWDSLKNVLICDSYEELILISEDRIIFNTVGDGGVMPVTVPEQSIIDGRETEIKLAVINKAFNGYDGIIGI